MVSVLVPVYNKTQEELTRCFESILMQTDKNFELIITDDGSSSDVAVFLDEYTKLNKKRCLGGVVCYHYQNGGVWNARNRGQEKANGQWIMHVNADDRIELDTIESALEAIRNNRDVEMVFWGLRDDSWTTDYKTCGGDKLFITPLETRIDLPHDVLCATPFCDVTCLVRKDKALPFRPELIGAEFERQVRVIAACNQLYFIDRPFYNYVSGENTISATHANMNWRIKSIEDFREALIFNNFKTVDEYLIMHAVNVIHYAAINGVSACREIDNTVIAEIIRKVSVNELLHLTYRMAIISIMFRVGMFSPLVLMLRLAKALKRQRKETCN